MALQAVKFRNVVLSDKRTEEIISGLLKKEFFNIPQEEYWRTEERNELIKTAQNLGLLSLADEMILFT